MFIRLLIYIAIGVLVYRAAKLWFGRGGAKQVNPPGQTPLRADDVMIQDPVCGVYFARRDGVVLDDGEQQRLFCSEACRRAYMARNAQHK
jgi:hypothetical protein